MMMPWLILGVVNSFFFRVNTERIIDSLFCGKIFFAWLLKVKQ